VIEVWFYGSALAVLPFWGPMIVAPHAAFTRRWVAPVWIAVPPALCYAALVLPNLTAFGGAFAEPSPESLARVMAQPWAASAFWAYAGAFDLFVGRWMFFDAHERGVRFRWVSPILAVCVASGPVAFLLYMAVRAASGGGAARAGPPVSE
jgi:hypothetical protein